MGQTDVHQLAALLIECQVLANDTGPMHLAVGVGTPVINMSVGHVDFRETGPYGPGHWVVQPVLDCAPCDMAEACAHHRCKDLIVPEQVAELARHVLGLAPFPECWTGVRRLSIRHRCRWTRLLPTARWTSRCHDGMVWRLLATILVRTVYWSHQSCPALDLAPPDLAEQQQRFRQLAPEVDQVVQHAERLASLCHQPTVTASELKAAQDELIAARQVIMPTAMASPAFGPDHHGTLTRPLRWPRAGHKDESRTSGASLPNLESTDGWGKRTTRAGTRWTRSATCTALVASSGGGSQQMNDWLARYGWS